MKKGYHRMLIAALATALTLTMFPILSFAASGDARGTVEPLQAEQEERGMQEADVQPAGSGEPERKRTILLYDCGSNLETDAGLATYNLMQILASHFSSDGDITFLVMTGGSHKWQMDSSRLVFPGGVSLPEDAVVEYDQKKRAYAETPSDPESQISNVYNQIWEARGVDARIADGTAEGAADPNAGRLVLLDGDGVTGAEHEAVKSEAELMSDPATLKAFINYGAANFPAEKYDLILWDHGGGPKGGFGSDEHRDDLNDWRLPTVMSFDGIVEALSDNAVTNSDADGDGKKDKFDFVNFDACLMNSVELALLMADYADYYIASAETEPGYGQYYGPKASRDGKGYTGWLDQLGDPANDGKYNGPGGTYELGKVIVDDFYNFYEKETGDGHAQEGTLAVVDTRKMMDSQFVRTLTEMVRLLRGEAGNVEEDGLKFYDELKSYYNSIEYGGSELFDLGNLSALLSVVNSEVDEKHMDEADDYYINVNSYHDISRTLNHMLAGGTFMYAKGTGGITSGEQFYRTPDDELGFGRLGSSGMSIYFPGPEMTMSATDYFKEMDPVIDRLPDGDPRKGFLKDYEAAVAYYSMVLYSGKTVDRLLNDENDSFEPSRKSDLDHDTVMASMKDEIFGNWRDLVLPCMNRIGLDEEGAEDWFRALIAQQVDDAVFSKEVTVEKQDGEENGPCRITINGAKKRIVNSVERNIFVELPAMEEYIKGLDPDKQVIVNNGAQLSVGSVEGTLVSRPAGSSVRDMVRWYNESGGAWDLAPMEKKWYAVRDAAGDEHVASIYLSDEDGIYVPALVGTEADGTDASRLVMLEFAPSGDRGLTSFFYMNTEEGPVKVLPKDLARQITVMPVIVVRMMFGDDLYVPISHSPFTISAASGDSIRLDYMDIEGIRDIGDTDGDEKYMDSSVTVTDIYGYPIEVSDRIQIKKARIRPAVYTGEELEPELVYRGKTLRPGVDYIWKKERKWDEEAQELVRPRFIEPGDYEISLYGKGHYTGLVYGAVFSIVRSEEDAQALIDKAQSDLKEAQDAFADLDPNDPAAMKQLFENLFAAQNALAAAREELARTKDLLSKEQIAQMEDQIADLGDQTGQLQDQAGQLGEQAGRLEEQVAKLQDQLGDLTDLLSKASVIDISHYAVTMKTSFPYTGKAIRPAVRVSGVNESCYAVSYANNRKIGTARVTIRAKGDRYRGTITKTFRITKGVNTLKVKAKKATVKYKKLKKKSRRLKAGKVVRIVDRGQGPLTYKLVSVRKGKKSFKKKFRINAKTGKVTVKKGLKKGRYKVKVRIKAAGNANYGPSSWKAVTFTVRVK